MNNVNNLKACEALYITESQSPQDILLSGEVYLDSKREWRFRTVAKNGRVISISAEGYIQKSTCLHALGLSSPHINDVGEFSSNPRFSSGRKRSNYTSLRTN